MQTNGFFSPELSKRDRARHKLLAAAVELFGRKGPEGATVREIARAAGHNVAAIAYYFGSKEKLYAAVVEGILREIWRRLGEVLEDVARFRRQREPSPAEAVHLLCRLLSALYLRLLSRDDAVGIVRLVVREQLGPTAGFEIMYRRGFRVLHETLCFLVGVALGRDPRDRETIVRTHTLMGQVYFFAMSREAVLRRLGWRTLEGKNAELVVQILKENLQAVLTGRPPAGGVKPPKPGARATATPRR